MSGLDPLVFVLDEETEKFYAKNQWPAVRGSERFVDKAHLHSNAGGRGVKRERQVVEAGEIMAAVAHHFEVEEKELLTAKRGGGGVDNSGRAMAMKLCQELGSMKLAEIGEIFGIGSESGVTKTISRFSKRLEKEEEIRESYNMLCRDLTP